MYQNQKSKKGVCVCWQGDASQNRILEKCLENSMKFEIYLKETMTGIHLPNMIKTGIRGFQLQNHEPHVMKDPNVPRTKFQYLFYQM